MLSKHLTLLFLHLNLAVHYLRVNFFNIYSLTLKHNHHGKHFLLALIIRVNSFRVFLQFFVVFLKELRAKALMVIVLTILIEVGIGEIVILSWKEDVLLTIAIIGFLNGADAVK